MRTLRDAGPKKRWTWAEVQGAPPSVELGAARDIATAAIREALAEEPPRQARASAIEAAIMARFVSELGTLAAGWCWARDEGTFGGGVVSAWCCARHSVPDPSGALSEEDVALVADRAARGLAEWRAHLARVRDLVASLPAPDRPLALEQSVSRIADLVAQASGAGDAWYTHATQVIAWYLEMHGVEQAEERAANAVRGNWRSWVMPTPEDTARVIEAIRAASVPDALEAHRAMPIEWWTPPPDVAAREDALVMAPLPPSFDLLAPHLAAIEQLDRGREPDRAERMLAAVARVRELASHEHLSLRGLRVVHALAMGREAPSPVRTRPALAKGGAEAYGMAADLGLDATPVGEAAYGGACEVACNYLHVLAWHPFDDGNGRAARLAALWIDLRLRVGFASLVPAFSTPRVAGDAEGAWGLVRTLLASAEAARSIRPGR